MWIRLVPCSWDRLGLSIENAQEYLALLSRELDVAKQETQADIAREADSQIPESGVRMPRIILMMVVFPGPFGPKSSTISLGPPVKRNAIHSNYLAIGLAHLRDRHNIRH